MKHPRRHVAALAGWIIALCVLAGAGSTGVAWALRTLARALR